MFKGEDFIRVWLLGGRDHWNPLRGWLPSAAHLQHYSCALVGRQEVHRIPHPHLSLSHFQNFELLISDFCLIPMTITWVVFSTLWRIVKTSSEPHREYQCGLWLVGNKDGDVSWPFVANSFGDLFWSHTFHILCSKHNTDLSVSVNC